MTDTDYARIRSIRDFETLVEYLRDELDWPLDMEIDDVDDLAFEYEPDELGLDKGYEVKVREVKQLRPASSNQPWGIFYVDFETKRLPIVVLRRALRALVPKKRASAAASHQATWDADDLLFIAATGEAGNRGISFAHFEKNEGGQPRLKTVTWDEQETHFFYLKQNIARLRWPENESDTTAWRAGWASAFPTEHREVIKTSKELSAELARLARSTRDMIRRVYDYEAKDGALHKLHESFKTVLIEDLDVNGFSDMVAQTISYGLFSARATGDRVLGLAHLERMVPNTNPFLKELFAEFVSMSGHEKHQIDFDELGVSDLVDMLNEVNVEAVLQDFGKQTGGGTQDPVIYFYEDFLKDYDKAQKVKRGEFYTPKPVVSYIVRSVDRVLRDELDCPDGLADTSEMEWNGEKWPKVMILDPATGTGTFLETVIEVIHETMTQKWKKAGKKQAEIHTAWNEYVPKHLLPRLHGFELMMAPYSVAHMKLGLKLKETGYEFASDERLRVYLTNTLEEPQDFSGRLYADFLAHEAEAANRVKREVPVTVVIGNPPYSGHSANKGQWIRSLVYDAYIKNYPELHKPAQAKWLSDDYVKFTKYGQWHVENTGLGVLAFVTNHGYLDNPTFQGMRESLMDTFEELYILDLHGNAIKKERTPQGGKDKNVFDIKQGVSINILVRKGKERRLARVHRADLWGSRESKYGALAQSLIENTWWIEVEPDSPSYLFVQQDKQLRAEYELGWKIPEIMDQNGDPAPGIVTTQDQFAISWSPEESKQKIRRFLHTQSEEEARATWRLCSQSQWNYYRAKAALMNEAWENKVQPVLYRPFDVRWTVYDSSVAVHRRDRVMQHMLGGENLGMSISRSVRGEPWRDALATNLVIEFGVMATRPGNSAPLFPLYLYPSDNGLLSARERRRPNLAPTFIEAISDKLSFSFVHDGCGDLEKTFGPEDVFNYAYAIFYSHTYRRRYAEFLRADFPRLPLTSDLDLFSVLSQWGKELVTLHLMRSPLLDDPFTAFPKSGSNLVEKARHDPEENRVYINKERQYFGNVPEETWNFYIGGYQVLDKWLKDRKGRTLSEQNIEHYMKVVKVLHETARIMGEIDEVIEAHGGWPLVGSVKEESEVAMEEDAR